MPADDSAARGVLSRYPAAVAGLDWVRLGAAGGFSGAHVWRGDLGGRPAFALKAWPAGYPAGRLVAVHGWMTHAREAAGLPFVPAVARTVTGGTVAEAAGRVWDVTAWMPGAADFPADPSVAKLAAACGAVAALHRAWAGLLARAAPCPGVGRRLAVLWGYRDDPRAEVGPRRLDPTSAEPLRKAVALLPGRVPAAVAALRPWAGRSGPVFPCLCDVHADHVLFAGDAVTGVIDYGAMKVDHPAVDLARLLGDLVPGDSGRMAAGLAAYHAAGGPGPVDPDLVAVLDATGVVCAVVHWVRRLTAGDPGPDPAAVAGRLGRLVGRLEGLFPAAGR